MKTDSSSVGEMVERVIELSRTYAIWWELVEKSKFDHYSKVIVDHEDFFATVMLSLFQGFTVITYQLFDNKNASLRTLVDGLQSSDPILAKKLKAAIHSKEKLLSKVRSIRCNVYGHRNKSNPPEHFFADAGLTPEQMREIVDCAREVVSALAESTRVANRVEIENGIRKREECSRTDLRRVMQVLTLQTR